MRQGKHRVFVGIHTGAWRHAEEPRLRVDRVQSAVIPKFHPADVVTDRFYGPAFDGRYQHSEIRFAAGAWKRTCNVAGFTLRARDLQDQHVLREPSFIFRHGGSDTQCETLLTEQGIPAVTRTERPYFSCIWKM